MVGILQRTQDVSVAINLPYHDPPSDSSVQRFIPLRFELRCSILYNPTDDDCVLVNYSDSIMYVANLDTEGARDRVSLARGDTAVLTPGMWRISVKARVAPGNEIYLLDFLVLRRQFGVSIHEEEHSGSKRKTADLHNILTKRQRREEDADATEIIFAPTTEQQVPSVAGALVNTSSQQIVPTGRAHILDLNDGDVAVIRSRSGISDYELRRLEKIAMTSSASVFAVHHSALSNDVVDKVLKYKGKTADFARCASNWEQEKTILEKLSHVSN